jgi:hypothetical protein
LLCWGDNRRGQLADLGTLGSASDVPLTIYERPLDGSTHPLEFLQYARTIHGGGHHTCAVLHRPRLVERRCNKVDINADVRDLFTRTVVCWGAGHRGQLGAGDTLDSVLPVAVLGSGEDGLLDDVAQLSVGAAHTCGLRGTSELLCWGANDQGQLGDGTRGDRLVPTDVTSLLDVTHVGAGPQHTCAVQGGLRMFCWGLNDHGQLGDETDVTSDVPVAVNAFAPVGA